MDHRAAFSSYAAGLTGLMAPTASGNYELERDDHFDQLARELFALQFEHNPVYQRYCRHRGVESAHVYHWKEIPALPTTAFREWDVTVLDPASRSHFFRSSGTTSTNAGEGTAGPLTKKESSWEETRPSPLRRRPAGPKGIPDTSSARIASRHFHSAESIALYEASAWAWLKVHLLPGRQDATPYRWLCLTPSRAEAPHSSLVHMFELVQRCVGPKNFVFLGRSDAEGIWQVDVAAARQELETCRKQLLILGTTFSFVNLLDELARQNFLVRLPPGSGALETGGYKGRSRALPKAELYKLLTARLGVDPGRIISEFGMSELSSQAYNGVLTPPGIEPTRMQGPFQFPPWARAHVVSPETGRPAEAGQPGLLRVVDLANVWSLAFIQTSDLAVAATGGFELLGRALEAEPRGCSLMSGD